MRKECKATRPKTNIVMQSRGASVNLERTYDAHRPAEVKALEQGESWPGSSEKRTSSS